MLVGQVKNGWQDQTQKDPKQIKGAIQQTEDDGFSCYVTWPGARKPIEKCQSINNFLC